MPIRIMELEFNKNAQMVNPQQLTDIKTAVSGGAFSDVVVMSHGWNNDMNEARQLYSGFFGNLANFVDASKVLAVGVLWPSKKFAESELIPGGAAGFGPDAKVNAALVSELQKMKAVYDDADSKADLDALIELAPKLSDTDDTAARFVALLGKLEQRHRDASQDSPDEGTARIAQHSSEAKQFLRDLDKKSHDVQRGAGRVTSGAGGVASIGVGHAGAVQAGGAAAGLGSIFSGIKNGALQALNLFTYYTMKDRAGKVGRDGLNPALKQIQDAAGPAVRFHLVGHSFGGRLVTAAVDGPNAIRVNTLLLLQAAYSHNGLALNFNSDHQNGFFCNVLTAHKVNGPILITHSSHDKAVGLAYPLASRMNGDNAAAFGGKDDPFGGMGANGAQHVNAEELTLLGANGAYNFKSGSAVFNLNGDAIITSHGDIARAETAWALAAAMKA